MKLHKVFRLAALTLVLWICVPGARAGVRVTTLYSFSGPDGIDPEGQLVEGSDGCFYGTARDTAQAGGNAAFGLKGLGTVFKITTNGVLTTLLHFAGTNGAYPRSGLLLGRDGNFYGTTAGGNTNKNVRPGYGTVFRMTRDGSINILACFHNSDGAGPCSDLIESRDGTLFGTAPFGGIRMKNAPNLSPGTGGFDYGTLFKVTRDNTLTAIFRFERTNGSTPFSSLVQGLNGYFYGTTESGGAYRHGTAFRISANGEFKSLFDFGGTNGVGPNGLILATDGNLYGTTSSGGLGYQGTVFRMTPAGEVTTLACFNGTDAGHPDSRLVTGGDGSLYGITESGGTRNQGTLFRVDSRRVLTIECSFTNRAATYHLNFATLVRGKDGNIYGTMDGGKYR
ncbi:MAG TPA: choice-of-anchor tandem repeat GloVer-containing protein, partial [Verrucomicrobiae bacterium]